MPERKITRARELRREQTPYERRLWQRLRDHRMNDVHFRRQHCIGPYIADFACVKAKLIVELDGSSHEERRDADEYRDRILADDGWKTLRFSNVEVRDHLEGVWERIRDEVLRRMGM
jgi:very-short-patch-repair endonuclease